MNNHPNIKRNKLNKNEKNMWKMKNEKFRIEIKVGNLWMMIPNNFEIFSFFFPQSK